ncbi:2-oxoacid:ferredoxin oxidoreductase subunit beta [Archaeoglobales archaeon ex4484_92]|nr:MAG: 2-oxoacid:ferredoxin oxidoreductase subunit beta [Archaeoglobales archaeon ex4484_92]
MSIKKYLINLPHTWCPGCGNGIVLGAFLRAIDGLKIERDKIVIVSGIGCSGRIAQFVNLNAVHTTHGRALAFATGIKLANPELKVVVMMGDGDSLAIGGNHFIHAARRNIELLSIIFNNSVYGMTGGQASPTAPEGQKTVTTPYGNIERPFDVVNLALATGASYVARWTTYHVRQLERSIREALQMNGFSVIEVITGCPTRMKRKPSEILKAQKEIKNVGVFKKENSTGFVAKYMGLMKSLG